MTLARNVAVVVLLPSILVLWSGGASATNPDLPATDGEVLIAAQPVTPGEARFVKNYIRYPGGSLANVNSSTGLVICLHNWGGHGFDGAPCPEPSLSNTVVIGVDYYQSGDPGIPGANTPPYDFGCVQAIDALRGLQYVYQGLIDHGIAFDQTRIYGMGGSGGGNVILMANKFAPRTFAAIVDCSGIASLTDDIAFNLPGGSLLDARYRTDPASPVYLTEAMQEIRDTGRVEDVAKMVTLGNQCKTVVIHGEDDVYCLISDKKRVVNAMLVGGLDVEPHYIAAGDVDGTLIINSGHSIGDRTALMTHFAGDFMTVGSGSMCQLAGPCDFARKESIVYSVSGGIYTVSYTDGVPSLGFTQVPSHR